MKAVELSDDEDKPSEEGETSQIDGDDGWGGRPAQDPISSKRFSQIVDFARPDHWRNRAERIIRNNVVGGLTTAAPIMEISSRPFKKMRTKTHSARWD